MHFVWSDLTKWHVICQFPPTFLKTYAQNIAARHKSWQNGVWFSAVQEVLEMFAGVRIKAKECMLE